MTTIKVKVKPGSKVDQLFYDTAGLLCVKLKAPAQDGKANAYLLELLANELNISKSAVRILSGFTSPIKRLEIDLDPAEFEKFRMRLAIKD